MARPKNKRKSRDKPATNGRQQGDGFSTEIVVSERFNKYYKSIVPEDEWDRFMEVARSPLPTTFRLSGSREIAQDINDIVRDVHMPAISNAVTEDGTPIPAPTVLPWYPGGLAWQVNMDKSQLRKSPDPLVKKFHRFLVYETENGNVSRSEAVSMLPPLFLEVEPHHKVLDMCAAPGSKTSQLLEGLHSQDPTLGTSTPPGMLVANDSNFKRAQMLVHQLHRLPSPTLMVINLDASNMPNILDENKRPVYFDRVLADVPCSGDGTSRKNPGIWRDWRATNGLGLHGLQLRILQRAMKIVDHHGRVVYSTCSLNPIENEAVVAAALESNPDFELLDVSEKLPSLIRRPGLTSWRTVVNAQGDEFPDWETYLAAPKPKGKSTQIHKTHFVPEDVERFHLERCLRIYPHLQDTGGFFVAVLEKKHDKRPQAAAEPSTSRKRRSSSEPETDAAQETKRRKVDATDNGVITVPEPPATTDGDASNFKEIPFTLLEPDNPVLLDALSRVSLLPTFPRDRIFVRNPAGTPARSLYIVNELVKSALLHNSCDRIRLVHAGVRVIEKKDSGPSGAVTTYRILEEGVAPLLPYVDESKIVTGDLASLKILLEDYYPGMSQIPEPLRSVLEDLPLGNVLCRFEAETSEAASLPHAVVLPLFKNGVSVSLMTDKKSKSAMSFRVFGEDVTPQGKLLREQQAAKAAAKEGGAEVAEEEEEEEVVDGVQEEGPREG